MPRRYAPRLARIGSMKYGSRLKFTCFVLARYNLRLCSISLAGWPCRVSQALQNIGM